MYAMKYDYIYPPFPYPIPSPSQFYAFFFVLIITKSSEVLFTCTWVWGHLLKHRNPTSGHSLRKQWLSLSQELSIASVCGRGD